MDRCKDISQPPKAEFSLDSSRNRWQGRRIMSVSTLPFRLWALLLMCALATPWFSSANEIVLVEEGQSPAPILLPADAPPATLRAAGELAEYIDKISGQRPEIITGTSDPLPASGIWVGWQPVVDELFPDLDFDFQNPEEILLAARDSHVILAGRDRWDPDQLEVEGRNFLVEDFQQEYGTANAVYTFLHDQLGVRWLWPGELGEDVPRHERIVLEPFEFRYHPPFRLRSGVFRFSAPGDGRGRAHDWARFQRVKLDSSSVGHRLQTIGSHAFGNWWERFHEEHPDYFALQPDGTRNAFPSPGNVKLCESNPAVWDQWIEDVAAQLEENPYQIIFNAAPNDSHSSGICVCANCLAWDHPDGDWALHSPEGQSFRYSWEGITQNYVLMSDRYVTFANQLGRKLKERYPDEDYYVLIFAYGPSLPAPVEAVPDDNVLVAGVQSFLLDHDVWTRTLVEDWAEKGANLFWRPNTPHPGWTHGYPVVPLSNVMKGVRYFADHGGRGIFIDTLWESSWATQGPLYYLLAQLTWDPFQDGNEILEEYYQRAYGEAADEMAEYWALMETATLKLFEGGRRAPLEWFEKVYNAAFFDQAEGFLDRALDAVEGEPEIYGRRIGFVRAGLDFTKLAVEQESLNPYLREVLDSGGTDLEAMERSEANWEEIQRLGRENRYLFRAGDADRPNNHTRPPKR